MSEIPFHKFTSFNKRDIHYTEKPGDFKNYITNVPSASSFSEAINRRKNFPVNRSLLTRELEKQYRQLGVTDRTIYDKIKLLDNENVFTITTAHQPVLLTGPLYAITKAISAIKLADQLNEMFAETVIPIYVLGGEDHDFKEINQAHLFGHHLVWNSEDIGNAVGRITPEGIIDDILPRLREIFGDSELASKWYGHIREAYQSSDTFGEATHKLLHEILKTYNLLILRMDNAIFKDHFKEIFWQDIEKSDSVDLVADVQSRIENELGYTPQTHIRQINVFYFHKGYRLRIEKESDHYKILDTDLTFSQEELKQELEDHPEKFSPNVILRPLFQEMILPDIGYIGGGGELAYWLERREQFKHFQVFFPVLVRRDSIFIMDEKDMKWLQEINMDLADLSMRPEDVEKKYIFENALHEIDFSHHKVALKGIYDNIANLAGKIEQPLIKYVGAEHTKAEKNLDHIRGKLFKAQKRNHEQSLSKLHRLREKYYPERSLQERHENIFSLILKYGDGVIDKIYRASDPLNKKVKILTI